MNHWAILPVLLPALLGAVMAIWPARIALHRTLALGSGLLLVLLSFWLLVRVRDLGIEVYRPGNWPAPFGIVLVLDRLATLMLALTATLSLFIAAYAAASGWDRRGRQFHALFQFQLMGLNGAFLTGDAFNLFVFFEVMLIASYGLMVHSGGGERLRAGLQYMVANLVASALFLIGLGILYATTGTLNMADMAERAAAMPASDTALLRLGATLLLIVFAIKSALVPLHFWLPATYQHAPAPVAALFSLLTKVGAYAILRTVTLIFPDSGPTSGLTGPLLPAALLTLAVGAIGSLDARSLPRLLAFAALASMGTLLAALSLMTEAGITAALFYMIHSTLAGAALFLIADLVAVRRAHTGLTPEPMTGQGMLGALFLIAAIAMAGMPPLAGFLGKLMLLQAALPSPHAAAIWATVLVTALVSILAFARAGSVLFWKSDPWPPSRPAPQHPRLPMVILAALLATMLALAAGGGPVMKFTKGTAFHLGQPAEYINAVLGKREAP